MTTYTYNGRTGNVESEDEDGHHIDDRETAWDMAASLYDGGWRVRDRAEIKSEYFGDDDGDGVDILIQWIMDALTEIASNDMTLEVER